MGVFQKGQTADKKRLKRVKYPLPEVAEGAYVVVRALSQKEVMDLIVKPEEERKRQAAEGLLPEPPSQSERPDYKILALCLVNDEGEPIFESAQDVELNFDVSAESMVRIVERVVALSGLEKREPKN